MAMRTASPWWASLVFGLGLFFILLGERLFGHLPTLRMTMTVIGVLALVGITGLRGFTTARTQGRRRAGARTLVWCQVGALVSLLLWALTAKWGMGLFTMTGKGAAKYSPVLTVLWAIGMVRSIVPMFMIEMSLGRPRRTAF